MEILKSDSRLAVFLLIVVIVVSFWYVAVSGVYNWLDQRQIEKRSDRITRGVLLAKELRACHNRYKDKVALMDLVEADRALQNWAETLIRMYEEKKVGDFFVDCYVRRWGLSKEILRRYKSDFVWSSTVQTF